MIIRVALTVFFALVICQMAKAQTPIWTQLPNSPSGTTPRNDDIYFVNENIGWAARSTDGIYKTTDAGYTWMKVLTNPTTHFRCIGFASATRGWAGNLGPGSYDAAVTDTNVLYQTFDGGASWSVVPGLNQTGMKGFCSMHILDSQHIYGGGRVRGPAYFVKSTDGGTNWTVTNLTSTVMGGIMDVYFKDTTNGFLVGMDTNVFTSSCSGYRGCIARTTNGGVSWQTQVVTSVQCCYFWKMSWPTPNVGYVSLQQNGTMVNHIFYKTTDGGNTWVSNGIPFSTLGMPLFYWQGIGFVSTNEGWAGGDSQSGTTNFLHTTDGGATWTRAGYNNSIRINRIRFLSPTLGYAAGGKLNVFRVPLAITNQPQDQWVSPGVDVTLNVGVYGNPPFSNQWRKDNVNILNATNATYSLTSVVRSNSADYSVVVTNASGGSLTSSNATLRVFTPEVLQSPVFAGGQVRVLFGDNSGGAMNSNYIPYFLIHASTNLESWDVLNTSLSVTNDKLMFLDSNSYPQRFYRVLEQ